MLIYIVKSAACLALLLLFYKIFLEKENMHVFKRFYLIGSLVLSLAIPALVFTEYIIVSSTPTINELVPIGVQQNTNAEFEKTQNTESFVLNYEPILWIIYALGLFFFGYKFFKNLFRIVHRIKRNPKYKNASFIQVLLQEKIVPHTFFNYIFLNKTKFETNTIPKEVLLHEETHARQKHSTDVLLIEMLQVVFWFNPLFYFFKKAIKLNHEFLADQAVLTNSVDIVTYQNTLLSFLSSENENIFQPSVSNAINYSSIKKRITIMKSTTSKKAVLFRSLLLLPLLTVLLYGFSNKKTITIIEATPVNSIQVKQQKESAVVYTNATPQEIKKYNSLAKKYNAISVEKRVIPLKDLKTLEVIYRKMSDDQKTKALPFPECPQDGATKEQVTEYNALAKKYNLMMEEEVNIRIKKGDVNRLEYLHNQMTEDQRSNAEPFPDFPEPPEPPMPPHPMKKDKAEEIIKEIIAHQDPNDVVGSKFYSPIKPVAPNRVSLNYYRNEIESINSIDDIIAVEEKGEQFYMPAPPAPPKPKTPLDHIIEMAKKDAIFYFEKKEISADEAIKLLKENDEINIESKKSKDNKPIVKLTTEPIEIGN
ncbi:M56 family metallopeptidase [Aurantibacter crassamenti]|uniref:M56 family metallopeptidase n=1 Tax=Aurantibacter crassamenti TaxID=1837375 RepID=UPI00193A6C1F|nr:M56 family metallopeptidase [Aurantibacter crassamenti]MBM1105668.1 M56 family metallopeptidase [Aurantibacter crassamenti]